MGASFAWGFLAAAPLIVGSAVALQYRVGERTLGLVMAFGSGVLISAVAFELVQEAWDREGAHAGVAPGLFAGSLTFWAGDAVIDRRGGAHRKHSGGRQAEGSPLAIVPEGSPPRPASSRRGWKRAHILALWLVVALTLGLAALAGYALLETCGFALAFAINALG